jgi:hypothetical protein
MPTLPRLTRWRLLLAGLLLAVAALVYLILTAPGPMDDARAKYDRIEDGMTTDEVAGILSGWQRRYVHCEGSSSAIGWYDPRTGVTTAVSFHADSFGTPRKVTGKHFDEGDQSFRAKLERLKGRLADKLHLGP